MSTRCRRRALSSASAGGLEQIVGGEVLVEGVAREREVLAVHQNTFARSSSSRSTSARMERPSGEIGGGGLGDDEVPGRVVALDEAVGEGVDAARDLDRLALVPDLDRALVRLLRGVEAEGDALADERGVDLEGDAIERDGAVLLDVALLLGEEVVAEVGRGHAHTFAGAGPLVGGALVAEAAVRSVVVFALDPGGERAVERVERGELLGLQQRQELHAHGAEPALHLPLALRGVGLGVDERDAELGADDRELLGAEGGAIVDVEPLGDAAAAHGVLEHRRKLTAPSERVKVAWGTSRVASSMKAMR